MTGASNTALCLFRPQLIQPSSHLPWRVRAARRADDPGTSDTEPRDWVATLVDLFLVSPRRSLRHPTQTPGSGASIAFRFPGLRCRDSRVHLQVTGYQTAGSPALPRPSLIFRVAGIAPPAPLLVSAPCLCPSRLPLCSVLPGLFYVRIPTSGFLLKPVPFLRVHAKIATY